MRPHRLLNILVVIVFSAGTGLPLVQQATDLIPEVEVVDNRPLAPFPALSSAFPVPAEFPTRFESWYADHLGMRGRLVASYRWLTDDLLRSPDKIIIGQENWLYLRKGVREDIETVPLLRDWCGRFNLTKGQLSAWVETITANQKWLANQGIEYLFVVPPNKMTVIPDYLPSRIQCRRGDTRLGQLFGALARRDIHVVDLRGVLRRAAETGESIWYRTDTHWNPKGVSVAYEHLAARIRELLPHAGRIEHFEAAEVGRVVGDLGQMFGGHGLEPDPEWAVGPVESRSQAAPIPFPDQADAYGRRSSARVIDNPELPSVMVFHDSFFDGAMNAFLAESFSRSVFVFHGRPDIDRDLVSREKPDLVVHEMVERNLLHPFFPRDSE